jgi:hypothetical protein
MSNEDHEAIAGPGMASENHAAADLPKKAVEAVELKSDSLDKYPLRTPHPPSEALEVESCVTNDGLFSLPTVLMEEEEDVPPPPSFISALFNDPPNPADTDNMHFPMRPPVRPWNREGQRWTSWRSLAWAFCRSRRIIYSDPAFTFVPEAGSWEAFKEVSPLVIRDRIEMFLFDCGVMATFTKPNEVGRWLDGIQSEIKKLAFPIRIEPNLFQIWAAHRLAPVKGEVAFRYEKRGEITTAEVVRAFLEDNPRHPDSNFNFAELDSYPTNKGIINRVSQKLNPAILRVFRPGNKNVEHVDSIIPRKIDGKTRYYSGFVGLQLRPKLGDGWERDLSPDQEQPSPPKVN